MTDIYGHTDETSALVVDDYPYGFRLRTSIRYWLETVPRKGDRFVSQTLNPKTGKWNKPKRSTYSPIGVMTRDDDNGHISWRGVSHYTERDVLDRFLAGVTLNDEQKNQAARLIGLHKMWENVTVSIHEGSFTPEEQAEQDETMRQMAREAAYHANQARKEL